MGTFKIDFSSWINAFRLRTLPLTLSSIGMGGFLAAVDKGFDWSIFILCCLTTLFLQILSNLANDYGDSVHGADHTGRKGPKRMVQSGRIDLTQMKTALIIFAGLALSSGLYLLYISFGFSTGFLFFLILGILAIAAAITYTAGHKPYGYEGLGDLSVLFFFGPLGVVGTYYLQTKLFTADVFLPALSCGFFATAVLNVNNIRDIQSDNLAGKRSIPVRIGRERAIWYHWLLLLAGTLCSILFCVFTLSSPVQFLFLLILPFLFANAIAVKKYTSAEKLDPYLKQMALTTLLYVVTFGIGNLLA